MMAFTRDGWRIVAVSNSAINAYGYSREEFLAMSVNDLLPPEDERLGPSPSIGVLSGLQSRHRYKDGTVIDVEITSDDLVLDGLECRIALCLNVTERNRTTAELAVARDEAVEASNMKSAFLANISHEIRTPMSGVLGMAELLLDSELDEDQRDLVTQVSRSGELMVALINDILDLSKIEAGQLKVELADFALRETIEQACAVAGASLHGKDVAFALQIADGVPGRARGDGQRLRQVLLNLVSNAVKFTSAGRVTVAAGVTPGSDGGVLLRVEVADTGIGIESSRLDEVFEPFTQADASTTRNYGGTGLGLAIARELVELMGGVIGAESKLGVGSRFWIELPLGSAMGGDGDRRGVVTPAGLADNGGWVSAPLVLVAEDNAVNQIVAARTLERCGCRVDVVADGREALAALEQRRYDAVLMDCQMPVLDGYEATSDLREREGDGHHTPVIAMTANAMNGAVEKCLAAGMDDYISKPMRRADLVEVLHRWIAQDDDDAAAAGDPNDTTDPPRDRRVRERRRG
jgi:PAS domain S-box-containing protein